MMEYCTQQSSLQHRETRVGQTPSRSGAAPNKKTLITLVRIHKKIKSSLIVFVKLKSTNSDLSMIEPLHGNPPLDCILCDRYVGHPAVYLLVIIMVHITQSVYSIFQLHS